MSWHSANPHIYLCCQYEASHSAKNILFTKCCHEMFWYYLWKKRHPFLHLKSFAEFYFNQCINLLMSKRSQIFWQINCSQKTSFKYSVKRCTCTLRCAITIIFVGVFHGSLPMIRWNHESLSLRKDSVTETLKSILNPANFLNGSAQHYLAQLLM